MQYILLLRNREETKELKNMYHLLETLEENLKKNFALSISIMGIPYYSISNLKHEEKKEVYNLFYQIIYDVRNNNFVFTNEDVEDLE